MKEQAVKIKFQDLINNKKNQTSLVLRVSSELRESLDSYASKNGLTSTHVIRVALINYLEKKGEVKVEGGDWK